MSKQVVAIVGRPNVGKSTFFNRCVGARQAIVDDTPGVTRDRIYQETDWAGETFLLVDTGGIVTNSHEEMSEHIFDQVNLAMAEADAIVFMVDGKNGLNGSDEEVANLLRRTKKPIILAVNKIDVPAEENNASEFFKLGLGEPFALSAMRGTGGVGDLLDKVVEILRAAPNGKPKKIEVDNEFAEFVEDEVDPLQPLSVAIVGRPNVGKSSILNVFAGKQRTIVDSEPGTTRDSIDLTISHKGREITLVDTAGIRRKSKVDYGIEAFAVVRSLRAIERSDVVVLVLDGTQEIADQDQKIGAKIEDAGRAAVIVVNKWDLIDNKSSHLMNEFIEKCHASLRMLSYAEVVFTSATTKQRVPKILEAVERAAEATKKRVSTGLLNQIVNEAVALVPPPSAKRGRRMKLYYTTQVSSSPPTFVLFVNEAKLMTQSYKTYLERKLRESFGFIGTPIRLVLREKKDTK